MLYTLTAVASGPKNQFWRMTFITSQVRGCSSLHQSNGYLLRQAFQMWLNLQDEELTHFFFLFDVGKTADMIVLCRKRTASCTMREALNLLLSYLVFGSILHEDG